MCACERGWQLTLAEQVLGPSHSVPIPLSILGMHLFGCKFSLKTDSGDTVPDRKNFDSLLWAIVTVFQVQPQVPLKAPRSQGTVETPALSPREVHRVSLWDQSHFEPCKCLSLQILTQEDWNVVLYNGMASTSSWAALYFVALMTFGNYVLFNLLVAILVEGFQAEVRGEEDRVWVWRCSCLGNPPPIFAQQPLGPYIHPVLLSTGLGLGTEGPAVGLSTLTVHCLGAG